MKLIDHIDRLFTGFLNPPLMHRGGIITQQMFLLLTFFGSDVRRTCLDA